MSTDASKKSVMFAFLANLGIAITKTVAAVLTKSGSMLAEAIHSYADCGNQALLFWGLKSMKRKPDAEHPLGHGMEIYFWSFIVALILFSMGGLFSIYEGVHKLQAHEGLQRPMIAIAVLSISIVLEGASLFGAITQIKKIKKKGVSLWKWARHTRRSELVVVLGEDIAALLGLTFALIAVVLATLTKNPVFDAMGSISIGVLLILVSVFLGIKVKSLMIGQSTDQETREAIASFLASRPAVEHIHNIITIQMGPQIMVSIKARMRPTQSTTEMIAGINATEKALKAQFPEISWVFFEPDLED